MTALRMCLHGPRLPAVPSRRQASANLALEGVAEIGCMSGLSSRSLEPVIPYSEVCLGLGMAHIFPKEPGHSVVKY